MSHVVRPPDLRDQIADLTRRLNALERTLQTAGKTEATDANGVLRALVGPLDDAGGAYVGQFGIYIADGSGQPIMDNTGLIGVMSGIGSVAYNSLQTITVGTSPVTVPNCTSTFTLTRAASVLVLGAIALSGNLGTSNTNGLAQLVVQQGGVTQKTSAPVMYFLGSGSTTPYGGGTCYCAFVNLAAGTYTGFWQVYLVNGSNSTYVSNVQVDAFRFGS